MRFVFCPYCGTKTILKSIGDEGMMPYCETCNTPLFDLFSSCVLCVVMNEYGEIALIKQGYVSDKYVGVAGYIKSGETAEQTAEREVREELGLAPERISYLKSCWHDKKGMLMIGFLAKVKKSDFQLSGEVDKAAWFSLEKAAAAVRNGSTIHELICHVREQFSES